MKKLYSEKRWRELSKRRRRRDLGRIRHRNKFLRQKRPGIGGGSQFAASGKTYRRFHPIEAPKNFSMINNPEEFIGFLELLRRRFSRKQSIEIDLSKTSLMTADAITVLVSRLKDYRFTQGALYKGNMPREEKLRKKFTESGFFEFVISIYKPKNPEYGTIRARSKLKVDARMALELIKLATKKLYNKYVKRGGVYKTLLECMNNTWDHAAGRKSRPERWWAAVHYDEDTKKASFTFVDNGVGIFESRDPSILQEALVKLRISKNSEMLRKMLRGEIPSITGIPYRGRGIPSIFNCVSRKEIDNLIVITNDVYANVKKDEFRTLRTPFTGTFLYWEISK